MPPKWTAGVGEIKSKARSNPDLLVGPSPTNAVVIRNVVAVNRRLACVDRSINKKRKCLLKVFISGVFLFFRHTAAAERTAEMPRRSDGGPSRHRGGTAGFFSKKSRAGARLQQVPGQVGQKHTAQAQGAKAKVHVLFPSLLFLLLNPSTSNLPQSSRHMYFPLDMGAFYEDYFDIIINSADFTNCTFGIILHFTFS